MNLETARNVMVAVVVAELVLFVGYFVLNQPDLRPHSNWAWRDEWRSPFKGQGQPPSQKLELPREFQSPKPGPKVQLRAATLTEAKELAEKHNKNVLLVFHAEWCEPCQRMQSETFADASVQAAMLDYVLLDVDTDDDRLTPRLFVVTHLPTSVVAGADGSTMDRTVGFKDAESFAAWLQKTKYPAAKTAEYRTDRLAVRAP